MRPEGARERLREWLTILWLCGWGILLWGVHRPWWLLGGWLDARIFWAERAALFCAPPAGFLLGHLRRRRLIGGRSAGAWPWLIVPALASMLLMLWLRLFSTPELLGVATTAVCGFASGGLTAGWGVLLRDDIPDLPTIPPCGRSPAQKDGSLW
jgi:hypothetical protein